MKRSNRGRPPRKESRHVVWLTTSTLKLWNERKRNLGFTNKSNNVFAEALLYGIVPREVDRNPPARKINKPVGEGNVERMLSMLARCRVSRIILFPMLFDVVGIESCMYTQKMLVYY